MMATGAKRMTKQQRADRVALNEQRFTEFNQELKVIDLDVWQDGPVSVINGYILGMFITRRADGYTILFQNRTTLDRVPPVGVKESVS